MFISEDLPTGRDLTGPETMDCARTERLRSACPLIGSQLPCSPCPPLLLTNDCASLVLPPLAPTKTGNVSVDLHIIQYRYSLESITIRYWTKPYLDKPIHQHHFSFLPVYNS